MVHNKQLSEKNMLSKLSQAFAWLRVFDLLMDEWYDRDLYDFCYNLLWKNMKFQKFKFNNF